MTFFSTLCLSNIMLDLVFHLKLKAALKDKSSYHLHVTNKEGGADKVK